MKKTYLLRPVMTVLASGLVLLPFSFCAWAAPEEDFLSDSQVSADMSGDGSEEEFSDEEIEKILEEFLHTDPEAYGMEMEESEVIEDAPWTMTWLEEEEQFQYSFDGDTAFFSSVPQGMVCSGPVSVVCPENGSLFIIKDGSAIQDLGKRVFTEPGRYCLMLTAFAAPETAENRMTFYKKNFYFQITDPVSSYPGVITAPEGFRLKEAALDGVLQTDISPEGIFLERDGAYRLIWEEPVSGKELETELTLDTSAPFLNFSQDITGGTAEIPLKFYPSEEDTKVIMEYNGFQERFTGDTLRTAGNYRLTVMDSVGNQRTYSVRLEPEKKGIPVYFIAMSFIVLAGAAGWLYYVHGHMRII